MNLVPQRMSEQLLLVLISIAISGAMIWYGRGWYLKKKSFKLQKKYFKGFSYLLDDESNRAVDTFLDLSKSNQEMIEIQLLLANLYRHKGEVDKAIRIHQELESRKNLPDEMVEQSKLGLALDFMKAGVFDRAERYFLSLEKNGQLPERALKNLITIYETEKDWSKAVRYALWFEQSSFQKMGNIIAHYYCELAELSIEKNHHQQAQDRVTQALAKHSESSRAKILEADLLLHSGEEKKAITAYLSAIEMDHNMAFLVLPKLKTMFTEDRITRYGKILDDLVESCANVLPILERANLYHSEQGEAEAIKYLTEKLRQKPSLKGLDMLMNMNALEQEAPDNILSVLRETTRILLIEKKRCACRQCGFTGRLHHWQCPSCKSWDSVQFIKGIAGE